MENLKHTETNLNITNMQQSAASYYKRCSIAFFALTVISGAVLGALAGKQILTGKTLAALALPGFLAVGSGVALLQKRNSQKIIDILQNQQERSQQLESLKNQQLTEKNQQLTDINNKVNTLTAEKESLNDQICRLKQDTQTNKELVSSLNHEIQEKQKNIEKLKKENESLRSSSKLSEEEQKKLLKNKEAESKLTDEIKKLEEQSKNLSSMLKESNQQVKELTEEIDKKEQFIKEQKTNHQAELEKLKQESTAKENQLNTQLKDFESQLTHLKQEKNQNEEKLQLVQNNLNTLKTQLQNLKNDKNQSESNLELNKDKIKNLEIHISETQKQSKTLKETIESQKTQLIKLNKKIQELSNENDSLKQTNKNLKQNIDEIKSQITALKEERDSQIAELKKTYKNQIDCINKRKEPSTQTDSQKITELTKKNNTQIEKIKINYNSKITELSEMVKKLENEKSKLSQQLQISKGVNEELKKQLEEEQKIEKNAIESLVYLKDVISSMPPDQHSSTTMAIALQIEIKKYLNEIQSRKKAIKLNKNQEKYINDMIAEFQSIGLDLNKQNKESLSNFKQENTTKGIELLSKISYELEKSNFNNELEKLYTRFESTYQKLNTIAKEYDEHGMRSIDNNKEYQSILEQAREIEKLFNPKMEKDFEKLANQFNKLSENAGKFQEYQDRTEDLEKCINTLKNKLEEFEKRFSSFEADFFIEQFHEESQLHKLSEKFATLLSYLPEDEKLVEISNEILNLKNEIKLTQLKEKIKSNIKHIKTELCKKFHFEEEIIQKLTIEKTLVETAKKLFKDIKEDINQIICKIEQAETIDELIPIIMDYKNEIEEIIKLINDYMLSSDSTTLHGFPSYCRLRKNAFDLIEKIENEEYVSHFLSPRWRFETVIPKKDIAFTKEEKNKIEEMKEKIKKTYKNDAMKGMLVELYGFIYKKEESIILCHEKEKIIKQIDEDIENIKNEIKFNESDREQIKTIKENINNKKDLEQLNIFCQNDVDYKNFKESIKEHKKESVFFKK